jgi:predicted nucleic acid-binding protein
MVILPSSNPPAALVIDANVLIAVCSVEAGRDAIATAQLAQYTSLGFDWYAPGVIVGETLYALCGKLNSGTLGAASHAIAIQTLHTMMDSVLPPPHGDKSLILRAEQIRNGYGCSRSADAIYLALAEQLSQTMPTTLLTFDQGVPNQVARNAPTVVVHLL